MQLKQPQKRIRQMRQKSSDVPNLLRVSVLCGTTKPRRGVFVALQPDPVAGTFFDTRSATFTIAAVSEYSRDIPEMLCESSAIKHLTLF